MSLAVSNVVAVNAFPEQVPAVVALAAFPAHVKVASV